MPAEIPLRAAHTAARSRWDGPLGLIASIALAEAVGIVGGLATASSVATWYAGLEKPGFNPPNWVFGPVWTTLYLLMGVAAWRVWRRRDQGPIGAALSLYAAQLALNLGWSLIFFGLRQPGWAFGEILLLLAALAATTLRFWRADRLAGALMGPYLAWTAFAAALNFAVWRLN